MLLLIENIDCSVFENKMHHSMRFNIKLRLSTYNALKNIQSIDYTIYYKNRYNFIVDYFLCPYKHSNIDMQKKFKRFYFKNLKKTLSLIESFKVDKHIYRLQKCELHLDNLLSENKISKTEHNAFKNMITHNLIKVIDSHSGNVFYASTTSTKGVNNKSTKLNNECVQELASENNSLFNIKKDIVHVLWGCF